MHARACVVVRAVRGCSEGHGGWTCDRKYARASTCQRVCVVDRGGGRVFRGREVEGMVYDQKHVRWEMAFRGEEV